MSQEIDLDDFLFLSVEAIAEREAQACKGH